MTGRLHDELLNEAAGYFAQKLAQHGMTPDGVDWNSHEGQINRFTQLTRILPASGPFSLNDLGCGYGALVDYLDAHYARYQYTGCDIAGDMVAAAQARFPDRPELAFVQSEKPPQEADYGVASGIFNLRQGRSDSEWLSYIYTTLDFLHETSRLGFAFNSLTVYSDAERMRPDLYYAEPCVLFDRCKRRYSKQVALLHDYGLYEFTILVRKD